MIPRYTRPQMAAIWEPENRFKIWLEIEILAMEALVNQGVVPAEALKVVKEKANFDIPRIDEIEKEVKHDVIAFLTSVAEFVGPEARFLHKGMTSSDVLDTCLAVQLTQASDILLEGIDKMMAALKKRALELKDVPCMGRSHGIHGEPISFGLKMALWYEEMKRNRDRLVAARERIAVGQISGAMGNFVHLNPSVEEYVCEKLGLKPDPVSTQVIQRDRHAEYFSVLAIIGATIEKIGVEIRHLQRTEVYEAEEFFSKGQKGSSAMPHKRNPILSENVAGMARLLRGYAMTAMENVPLWHERDISHSSAERVIGPDATIGLDFILHRMSGVVEKLVVYPENMMKHINQMRGLAFSQRVLLALTDKGCTREDAYRLVQRNAMKVWENDADFLTELSADEEISKYLSGDEVKEMFNLKYYLRHVDDIYQRVFQ